MPPKGRCSTTFGRLGPTHGVRVRASPSDIGEALGITRQAVYNRLHTLEQRAETDPEFVIPDFDTEENPDLETGTETKLDAR